MIHVFAAERRLQSEHLIDDAAQRPDVTLITVRLVSPYLRGSIVRCACLSIVQTLVTSNLADIHIAQLRLVENSVIVRFGVICLLILAEEDIRGLYVSVHDM